MTITVKFWYGTDLRCHEVVEKCQSEVEALVIALHRRKFRDNVWIDPTDFNFKVTMERERKPYIPEKEDNNQLTEMLELWMDSTLVGVPEADRDAAKPLFDALNLNVDDYI